MQCNYLHFPVFARSKEQQGKVDLIKSKMLERLAELRMGNVHLPGRGENVTAEFHSLVLGLLMPRHLENVIIFIPDL